MERKKVAVQACENYESMRVEAAVSRVIADLGGISSFVKKGQTVFLKANLVVGAEPNKATTTHPAVVAAVAKLVIANGAKVIIGDSPGGPYNKGYVGGVYKKTGMADVAADTGAELNQDFTEARIDFPSGVVAKVIPICNSLEKADVIINVAKLKTHTFSGLSGACKNMYGSIPGLVKVEWHQYFPELRTFADCLIDIQEYLRPKLVLHIVDAVDCMEGPGPTGGTPIHMGLVLGSTCYSSADVVCARLIGENPAVLPTLSAAVDRKLLNPKYEVEIIGQPIENYINTKYKRMEPSNFAAGSSRFVQWLLKRVFSQKPKVSRRKCKGCSKCKEHCPAGAITMKQKKNGMYATFDYNKCIRCFCCQELCPFHVVKVKTPFVVKIMQRSKRRRVAKAALVNSKQSQ